MSLTGFQSALAQLIIDADSSRRTRCEPDGALDGYDLTALERRRLVAIAHDSKLRVAHRIHQFFRINALLQSLPLTVRLLGDRRLRSLADGFWRLGAPRNYYYQREAARFGEYLIDLVERGELKDPYIPEVVRFELAAMDLSRGQQVKGLEAYTESETDWRPRLSHNLRLVIFEHAPADLLSCLERGKAPGDIQAGRYYLLLDGSSPECIRLVPLLAELGRVLQHCEGRLSVEEIGARARVSATDLQSLAAAGYLD